jgi:hypothetical protein
VSKLWLWASLSTHHRTQLVKECYKGLGLKWVLWKFNSRFWTWKVPSLCRSSLFKRVAMESAKYRLIFMDCILLCIIQQIFVHRLMITLWESKQVSIHLSVYLSIYLSIKVWGSPSYGFQDFYLILIWLGVFHRPCLPPALTPVASLAYGGEIFLRNFCWIWTDYAALYKCSRRYTSSMGKCIIYLQTRGKSMFNYESIT